MLQINYTYHVTQKTDDRNTYTYINIQKYPYKFIRLLKCGSESYFFGNTNTQVGNNKQKADTVFFHSKTYIHICMQEPQKQDSLIYVIVFISVSVSLDILGVRL